MSYNFSRILALAPHTDDIELGAGGTIARWVEDGKEIFYVAFSIAEKSVPGGLPDDILLQEAQQAIQVLGLKQENVEIHRFEARTFPAHRQEILELLVSLRDRIQPDVVLMPSLQDMHQDHRTIAEEGFRAFKYITILGYELPWNVLESRPSLFVALERRHLDKKVEAIGCYKSQWGRNYASEEFTHGLARAKGIQSNSEYAEAFDVVRWMVK